MTQLFEEISAPEVRALHEANAVAPDIVEELEVLTLTVVEAASFVVHDIVPQAAPPSENAVSKILETRVPEALEFVVSEPRVLKVSNWDL